MERFDFEDKLQESLIKYYFRNLNHLLLINLNK